MNISDLNYLEVVNPETGKALAGGGDIASHIAKDVNLNKVVNLEINKNVNVITVNLLLPSMLERIDGNGNGNELLNGNG